MEKLKRKVVGRRMRWAGQVQDRRRKKVIEEKAKTEVKNKIFEEG